MIVSLIIALLVTIPCYFVGHMVLFLPMTAIVTNKLRSFYASFICNAVVYLFIAVIFAILFVAFRDIRDENSEDRLLRDYEGKKYSFGRDILLVIRREKWVLVLFAVLSLITQAVSRFGRLYLVGTGSPVVAIFFTGFLPFSYPSYIRLYGDAVNAAFFKELFIVWLVALPVLFAVYVLVYCIYRRKQYKARTRFKYRR